MISEFKDDANKLKYNMQFSYSFETESHYVPQNILEPTRYIYTNKYLLTIVS